LSHAAIAYDRIFSASKQKIAAELSASINPSGKPFPRMGIRPTDIFEVPDVKCTDFEPGEDKPARFLNADTEAVSASETSQ
jgi:hypothetical protein